MAETMELPTCFMAMPITTRAEDIDRYGGDEEHWSHVMSSLFEKAIERAGFRPIKPVAEGSHLIHGLIIKHLSTADLVLVDLSSHNPNVFFELGVRTSLNLPVALVRDEHTMIPFDTSGINTHMYDSNLRGWEIDDQQDELAQHIRESYRSCGGQNPLWRQFGLTIKAAEPGANESPLEAKVDLLAQHVVTLHDKIDHERVAMREQVQATELEALSAHRHYRDRGEGVELFRAALKRFAGKQIMHRIDVLSPTEATFRLDASASQADVARIYELAERYGVRVTLRGPGVLASSLDDVLGTRAVRRNADDEPTSSDLRDRDRLSRRRGGAST